MRLLYAASLAVVLTFASLAAADSRDWSLVDVNGETFKLSSVLGNKPVLLVFWATWCTPCKKEMDQHKSTFESYEEKGVPVLLISEDDQKSQARVKPYVDSKKFNHRVLLDPTGEILKRYGGVSLPYTVLLDMSGKTVWRNRGALKDIKRLTMEIEKLLRSHAQ